MAETRKGRIKLLDRPFREGHVDAYIEGDTRPLWKGFRAGAGYSTSNEEGGFRRVGLTYHSDDDAFGGTAEWRNKQGGSRRFGLTYHAKEGRIGATAQFRFKKGGLARNIDGKAIQGRTNPKYF
jgi:hypothetical protein